MVTDRPPRICFCCNSLDLGGAQRRTALLANEATRRGYATCLLTGHASETTVCELLPEVEHLCLNRPRPFRRGGFTPLRRAIRAFRPDIYHGFQNVGVELGVAAARLARVPVVVAGAVTSVARNRSEGRLENFVLRQAFRWAHAVTVNSLESETDFPAFFGVPPVRVHYLPNFVEADQLNYRNAEARVRYRSELEVDDDRPVLIAVGRLVELKGHADLLEAFARLPADTAGALLVLVGDGPERARLEAFVAGHGLHDRVRLLGDRPDARELLQAADLLIHPSHHEGMPNVVLEAMACGLPVLATDISGSRELVQPARTGWLVPPRDQARLGSALAEALRVPREVLKELGRTARQVVETTYDRPLVTDRYFALYERLLTTS